MISLLYWPITSFNFHLWPKHKSPTCPSFHFIYGPKHNNLKFPSFPNSRFFPNEPGPIPLSVSITPSFSCRCGLPSRAQPICLSTQANNDVPTASLQLAATARYPFPLSSLSQLNRVTTHSQHGIFRPKKQFNLYSYVTKSSLPRKSISTLSDPNPKMDMTDEFNALLIIRFEN